jgi:hypothetical protein
MGGAPPRSGYAELLAVRAGALGLPRHGGRGRRDDGHRDVVLTFDGAGQRDAGIPMIARCMAR